MTHQPDERSGQARQPGRSHAHLTRGTSLARVTPRQARPCAVRGCCWRGVACPVHADGRPVSDHLAALVVERPYGRRWAA
ncbi:hypothetical protein [Saccharothrix deserti]|uniref:hypothetical protein n=1 Tax=Saccharothrix deserti TaxID=2593674 RepID=UPI00131C2A6C|nr:hypothetical protein [Saccharothrix deserti]